MVRVSGDLRRAGDGDDCFTAINSIHRTGPLTDHQTSSGVVVL